MSVRDVRIRIESEQSCEGQSEHTVKTYDGKWSVTDTSCILRYVSFDEDGNRTIHKIVALPESCEVTSSGAMVRAMRFLAGASDVIEMRLAEGSLTMETRTHAYELSIYDEVMGEERLEIRLSYDLYSAGEYIAKQTLLICAE